MKFRVAVGLLFIMVFASMLVLAQDQTPTLDPVTTETGEPLMGTVTTPTPISLTLVPETLQPDTTAQPGTNQEGVTPDMTAQPQMTQTGPDVTAEMTDETAPVEGAVDPSNIIALNDITDDLETYFGQRVTVEERLTQVVNAGAFYIENESILDREKVLVVYNNPLINGYSTPRLADDNIRVVVTGTVQPFNRTEFEGMTGYVFDTERFAEFEEAYEGRAVIVADTVSLAEGAEPALVDMIGDINDRSMSYFDVPVVVEADLVEIVGDNAYIIQQGNLFETNRILVIYNGEPTDFSTIAEADGRVQISGVVRRYVPGTTESELGIALNPDAIAGYEEGSPLILADSITPFEPEG